MCMCECASLSVCMWVEEGGNLGLVCINYIHSYYRMVIHCNQQGSEVLRCISFVPIYVHACVYIPVMCRCV